MSPDDPRHGSNAGFFAHRRANQEPCTACYLAKNRHLKELRIYGATTLTTLPESTWRIIDTTPPVALHRQTGVSARILRRLLCGGPGTRCRKDVVSRINAARPVSAIGITRRLRALTALGWSSVAMAEASGLHKTVIVNRRLRVTDHYIEGRTIAAVVAMYDDLSMRLAPSGPSASQARALAARHGWPPPLAYDNIDDASERPKGVGTTRTDRADVLADVDSWGGNATDACRALGIDRRTLQKWAGNHGCSELYRRLAGRETVRPNQYAKGDVA